MVPVRLPLTLSPLYREREPFSFADVTIFYLRMPAPAAAHNRISSSKWILTRVGHWDDIGDIIDFQLDNP
jgi:hypothetical protein